MNKKGECNMKLKNKDTVKNEATKDENKKVDSSTTMIAETKGKKKKSKKNKNKKKGGPFGLFVPKTAQDSIPYKRVYPNGMIEVEDGIFTKSYRLDDVNFTIGTHEEQKTIFLAYGDLLNSFNADMKAQITINNRNVAEVKIREDILLKPRNDKINYLRQEYNEMLIDKMQTGRNNLVREKYLTVSVETESVENAKTTFSQLDIQVSNALKRITGSTAEPLTINERLNILYDVFNMDSEVPFYERATIDYKGDKVESETFSLEHTKKLGLTTKDIIAPASFEFTKDYFHMGDKFGRVFFLDNLPTFLSTNLLTDLADLPCNMLTSVYFEPLNQDESLKMIKNQMVNINSNVVEAQKRASKSGYSPDLISPELMRAQREAEKLMEDITSHNQKIFLVTVVAAIFGDSVEELEEHTKTISTISSRYLCQMKKLNYQQEHGLAASLPLCNNRLAVKRMLTTESASVFIPFTAQELNQKNGFYYGINAVSNNLILFSRLNSKNANGVILGTPGSGKSFAAKREIINVLLGTAPDEDEVFIIDPEREYSPLADLLGGQNIKIAAGTKNYINPLDMDIEYGDEDDPITLKSDFISSLCETVIGGRYGLEPVQKSVIDRCVRHVYQPYMEHLTKLRMRDSSITSDRTATPTLRDFYKTLLAQPEPEAKSIALALEIYCTGSLDTFAHHTNVNTNSRFVVYDIKDIGATMKEMGLQVCLNDIWNRMIENKRKGKRTWLYIDEFYLLTQTESSAKFLQQIWKRARKWGGIPTGITQNVEDLLASQAARGIINNCDFILLLNQSPLDRAELAHMLNISQNQLSYITNSDAGQGLLYTGKSIVPFIDKFPTNTELYKVMTTKPDEVNTTLSEINKDKK